jgi:5-methylcytosine-specific restriction endonuclease McrA
MVTVKCKYCNNDFNTYNYLIKLGYGKYCSLKCRSRGMLLEFPRKKKVKTQEEIIRLKEYKRLWARAHNKKTDKIKVKRVNEIIKCGCGCGNDLLKYAPNGRERRFVHGHQACLYRKPGERPPHHEIQHKSCWNRIRKIVYKRDNWICQVCGKHCREDIQCHHKIPYRISKDNSLGNLITLCRKCHIKEEHKCNKLFLDTPHFERKV